MSTEPQHDGAADHAALGPGRCLRTAIGGVFMGVANLIPGVSGGTMILAIGLYEEFIDAVADVTALRFSVRRIAFLAILVLFALGSILALSKVILYLLFWHSSLMFALFIGLTLGGTPLLVRMIGRFRTGAVIGALVGFAVMVGVFFAREGAAIPRNTGMDVVSGVVGATTMVLPGISGSYMLLILDQYDRVIGAIADLKEGAWSALRVLIPFGLGVVLGVVGLSNLLKLLLHRYERITLGVLLGMLLGSVLGLWPFGRAPTEKILEKRTPSELVTFAERQGITGTEDLEGEQLAKHILEHWDRRTVSPYSARTVGGAIVMLFVGLSITVLLGRYGYEDDQQAEAS